MIINFKISLIILLLISNIITSRAQERKDLLLGNWIRYQNQKCDGTILSNFEFPFQNEFSFGQSQMSIRFTLNSSHSATYQYHFDGDTINIIENSKYEIININKSFLELRQILGKNCHLHKFQRKEEVLAQFKKEMEFKVFNSDTFYISNLALYPKYTGDGRIYDLVLDKFEKKLLESDIKKMEIDIYLTGSSKIVNVDIAGCRNIKVMDSIIRYIMSTNKKWEMPIIYNEPLNQIYTLRYNF